MNTYGKTLKEAIARQAFTEDDVAIQVGIKKGRLQAILDGDKQATLTELVAISSYVSLDLNQLLGIESVNNDYMLLDDELQLKLNSITSTIHKDDQKDFVKAVEYLAECFVIKDKQKK